MSRATKIKRTTTFSKLPVGACFVSAGAKPTKKGNPAVWCKTSASKAWGGKGKRSSGGKRSFAPETRVKIRAVLGYDALIIAKMTRGSRARARRERPGSPWARNLGTKTK